MTGCTLRRNPLDIIYFPQCKVKYEHMIVKEIIVLLQEATKMLYEHI